MREKEVDYQLQRKRKVFAWASKRSNTEISKRIDDLLQKISNQETTRLQRELAKEEATELARILQKRKSRGGATISGGPLAT